MLVQKVNQCALGNDACYLHMSSRELQAQAPCVLAISEKHRHIIDVSYLVEHESCGLLILDLKQSMDTLRDPVSRNERKEPVYKY